MEQERLNVVRDSALVVSAIVSVVLALFSSGLVQIAFIILAVALFSIKALAAQIYLLLSTVQHNIESVRSESIEGIRRVDADLIRLTDVVEELRRTPKEPFPPPVVHYDPPAPADLKPVWYIGGSAVVMLLASQLFLFQHVRGSIGALQSEISQDRAQMSSISLTSREAMERSDIALQQANALMASMASQVEAIQRKVGVLGEQAAVLGEISAELSPASDAHPGEAKVNLSASRTLRDEPLEPVQITALDVASARGSLSPKALPPQGKTPNEAHPQQGAPLRFEPFQSPDPKR